jgi:hypothetical protein
MLTCAGGDHDRAGEHWAPGSREEKTVAPPLDRLHRRTQAQRQGVRMCVAVEEARKLGDRQEAVGMDARWRKAGEPRHPRGRQEPEAGAAFVEPALADPAAFDHKVVDAGAGEAHAQGKPRLAAADDRDVCPFHGCVSVVPK